jgi:hypothetical protein
MVIQIRVFFPLFIEFIILYVNGYFQVSQGCKGSLNIAACEIVVSPTDHTRLDLIISAGEQVSRRHFSSGSGA